MSKSLNFVVSIKLDRRSVDVNGNNPIKLRVWNRASKRVKMYSCNKFSDPGTFEKAMNHKVTVKGDTFVLRTYLERVLSNATDVLESNVAAIVHDIVRKFDWKKPTTQMLGRWQPWHDGHTALFKKALLETGQVCIQVRNVGGIVGADAGDGRTATQDDNPFDWDAVCANIEEGLLKDGFKRGVEYEIMLVPNIVNITYIDTIFI